MKTTEKKPRYYRFVIPVFLVLGGLSISLGPTLKAQGFSQSESYAYDSAGRLTQVEYGNGDIIRYSYDDNGNILSIELLKVDTLFSDGFESLAFLNP
jgi:YD repeat-containing protein